MFGPNQTRLLSVESMLGHLNTSASEAPDGRITIIQRGPNPSLVAQGRVTDPVTGFSTTLQFPDPSRQHAKALEASGLPIGTPTANSPYGGDGYFTPQVIASNLTSKPQTLTITVEYPKASAWTSVAGPGGPAQPQVRVLGRFKKGTKDPNEALNHPPNPDPSSLTGQYTLAPLPVGPDSTVDFSLDSVMNQLPLPLPYISLRIQYSGAPGSVIAQASSVDEHQDVVVDARTINEGEGWAGSGANPWHLDSQTSSILFLTDEGSKPVSIGVDVTVGVVHYYLIRLKLAPHETRAIDLRALRDAQVPDFKGNKIPAGATDGSINWLRLDSVPVEGRLMVIEKQQGIASSYDCVSCPCPGVVETLGLAPLSFSLLPGDYEDLLGTATLYDCNGYDFYYDVTYGVVFTVDDTSVIQMDSSVHGRADAIAGGYTNVNGTYIACTFYDTNPDLNCPCTEMGEFYGSSGGTVQVPARLVHYNTSCAPNGVGPLQIISDGSVVDCGGVTRAMNFCGVNRNLTYQLVDQSGNVFQLAYTIHESFSDFSTTNSSLPAPSATSANIPAGRAVTDAQFLGFTYPTCLGTNDHSSYTQSFSVTVGTANYNLSTVVSISLGRFSGTPEDNVDITTP